MTNEYCNQLGKMLEEKQDTPSFKQKFLEVQEPFYKKVLARRRQS
jgi:hypothetical protein